MIRPEATSEKVGWKPMRISDLAGHALGVCTVALMLAGCSGNGSSAVAPSVPASSSYALERQGAGVTPLKQDNILYTFQGGVDGAGPYAGLLAQNGQYYGTTFGGGASDGAGTAFKLSPSGAKTILYTFQGGSDAANPQAGLIAGGGGALYGDTVYGGGGPACTYGCGTVYELVPSGSGYTEKVIYAFQGGDDGAAPIGNLLIDKSGALYGTTVGGGGAAACTTTIDGIGCGTVFKLTPSSEGYTETILYSFQAGNDGIGPRGTLIADVNGALYGTTEFGGGVSACSSGSGNAGCGTVFKLTPSSAGYSETVIYRFQGGTGDGQFPRSALVAGITGFKSGRLFGATIGGGANKHGTIYELTPSGSSYTERVFYSFNGKSGSSPSDENGLYFGKCHAHPWAPPCLYGTTAGGGTAKCFCGTAFKLTAAGTETVLHSFQGGRRADGSDPRGSLVADAAGYLYGTTFGGGTRQQAGTVFKVSP